MRPRRFSYTLSAADTNGFVDQATGAGPFATILGYPTDGLAHVFTATSAGGVNLSAIAITVTGLDENGTAQTEVIATGPNGNTVTGAKYWSSITSIAVASTYGANAADFGWGAACVTPMFVTDSYKLTGPLVTVGVGGTITFTAQQTNINPFENAPTWATLGSAGASATAQTLANSGTTAVRCSIASHTSGVLTLGISQARV